MVELQRGARTHTVIINYAGKRIVYDDTKSLLIINGTAFSTTLGPIFLRVDQAGQLIPEATFIP